MTLSEDSDINVEIWNSDMGLQTAQGYQLKFLLCNPVGRHNIYLNYWFAKTVSWYAWERENNRDLKIEVFRNFPRTANVKKSRG